MPILDWLNKDDAIKESTKVPYRLLKPIKKLSYGDPDSENMLIQGDNLEALKALLPLYAGQVKCIYIDPPFNTKQAFEHYDDNIEHSIWLSLLYPRLELLKQLLSETGTIYVHIDDNELGYLIPIMDEIFGRRNRISIVSFKQGSATGHKAINPGMVSITNFILVYSKNKERWNPSKVYTARERDSRYGHFISNYDESYKLWRLIPLNDAFAENYGVTKKELKKSLCEKYEEKINEFVISNAHRVVQPVRPDYSNVGEDVRDKIDESKREPNEVFLLERDNYPSMYFKAGQRWIFYKNKLKNIDGNLVAGEPLTTLWADLLSNNMHKEGGVKFPKSKKPESLIKRVLELSTEPGDIVLDSFLGSGTTAAVAHKMGRRHIGIEIGEHAETLCYPRLVNVVNGEQEGVSKLVKWQGGGGFNYYRLGATVFDEEGRINPDVRFPTLASHLWFTETGHPWRGNGKLPFLGIHDGVAYALLYNGILGDKSTSGGNVLTRPLLKQLRGQAEGFIGPWVIYGEMSRITPPGLQREGISFKQTPYDIKAR